MNAPASFTAHDSAAWRAQLGQLLPPGRAWTAPRGGTLDGLLWAWADAFSRAEARVLRLLDEADPNSALELLADWEKTTGLPDACFGAPDSITERQVAAAQRITGTGGQSRAFFVGLAALLGYTVAIEEHRPARCGDRIGVLTYGQPWRHVWRVHVLPLSDELPEGQFRVAQARIGSRVGVRLRGWGALDLECLIRRHAPAHSKVLFTYQIAPEPALWFDFTLD